MALNPQPAHANSLQTPGLVSQITVLRNQSQIVICKH